MNMNPTCTIAEVAEPGRTRQRSDGDKTSHLFIATLFAVITLFLLISLLVGVNVYRAVNSTRAEADETRMGLALVANSIRMNDATDAVGVADGPEGLALVLTEHLESGNYETRLYGYQGSIVQEYARADAAYTPEKARELVKSSCFDFTYANGLLTVYTDQGSTSVALRSVKGGVR